jgi:hypothetical protein
MSRLDRRDLLKAVLAGAVLRGTMGKAYAQAAGVNPRMLLYIQMYGSPPRWMFDQFLNPYASSGFVPNLAVGTRLQASGGRYISASYDTVPVTKAGWPDTIHVPWMWQFPVPAPGGTTRPMTDLLDNLLSIQGIDALSDQHEAANVNIQLPLGTLTSLSGLPVDYATTPIKAVEHNSYRLQLRSKQGASYASVGGSNLVTSLMTPFDNKASSGFQTHESQLRSRFSAAMAALSAAAKRDNPRAPLIDTDRASADAAATLLQSLGDLTAFWNAGVAKYSDLISRAFDQANPSRGGALLSGLSDLPVGTTGARDGTYNFDGTVISLDDCRDLITPDSGIGKMAAQFTLAEFCFSHRICQSLTVEPGDISLNINGTFTNQYFDEHTTGYLTSLFYRSFFWRAYAACMLELITALKTAGTFNDTVIMTAGEFARRPVVNGTDSDHSQTSANATFYCGSVQHPMVLGRMQGNSYLRGSSDRATIGDGDPALRASRDHGTLLVTAAQLLRVPPPLTARSSMVDESNGAITALAEKATLV